MAQLIRVGSKTAEQVSPENNKFWTLEELQKIVGGDIQGIGVGTSVMYMNENGKLEGLDLNWTATRMVKGSLIPGDYIAGDVIIVPQEEEQTE